MEWSTKRSRTGTKLVDSKHQIGGHFANELGRFHHIRQKNQAVDKRRRFTPSAVRGSATTLRCYARRPRQLSASEELERLLREQTDTGASEDDREEIDEIINEGWTKDWSSPESLISASPHDDPIDSPLSDTVLDGPWFETPPISTSSELSPVLYEPRRRPSLVLTLFLGLCDQLIEQLAYCGEIDYLLVLMVFVYFRRLPEDQRRWTPRSFYVLLYIAIQMEEEDMQSLECFVIQRVIETFPKSRQTLPVFQQEKARLWTALQYDTLVHVEELNDALSFFPKHRIFALRRSSIGSSQEAEAIRDEFKG